MIIREENKLMEFNKEELKILKFFLENSFKTLSDIVSDPVIGADFVFPGIYDLDKQMFRQVLNKLEELNVNIFKIDPHSIQDTESSLDDFLK